MAEPHGASTGLASRPKLTRALCLALGVVYTVVGAWGLIEGGFSSMRNVPATVSGPTVGGFGGSPFLNLAHLILGLIALGAGITRRGAFTFGTVALVALTAFIAYDTVALIAGFAGEPLSVHWPALVLHVVGWLTTLFMVVAEYRRTGMMCETVTG